MPDEGPGHAAAHNHLGRQKENILTAEGCAAPLAAQAASGEPPGTAAARFKGVLMARGPLFLSEGFNLQKGDLSRKQTALHSRCSSHKNVFVVVLFHFSVLF